MKAPSYIAYMLEVLNDIDSFNVEDVKYRLLMEKEKMNKAKEDSAIRKIEFKQVTKVRSLTPR